MRNRNRGQRGWRNQRSGGRWRNWFPRSTRTNEREPVRPAQSRKVFTRPGRANQSADEKSEITRKIREDRQETRRGKLQLERDRKENDSALSIVAQISQQ